jgi:hypothetical protein
LPRPFLARDTFLLFLSLSIDFKAAHYWSTSEEVLRMTYVPSTGLDLSIIIPILDERDNLQEFYRHATMVLTQLHRTYEIILSTMGVLMVL